MALLTNECEWCTGLIINTFHGIYIWPMCSRALGPTGHIIRDVLFPGLSLLFLLVPITDIPKWGSTKWHNNAHGESWEGWRRRQEGIPQQSWLEGDHCPLWSPAPLMNSPPWFLKTVTTSFTLMLLVEIHASTVLMLPSDDAQWTVQNGFIPCAS